jgi:hypothetical protein
MRPECADCAICIRIPPFGYSSPAACGQISEGFRDRRQVYVYSGPCADSIPIRPISSERHLANYVVKGMYDTIILAALGSNLRPSSRRTTLLPDISAMRVLVEPSDYSLLNVGDVAMLDVATARLHALWPNAIIEVLTDTPEYLPRSAHVKCLSAATRRKWFEDGYLSCAPVFPHLTTSLPVRKLERLLRS